MMRLRSWIFARVAPVREDLLALESSCLQLRAIGVVAHQIVAIPVAVRVVRVLAVVIVVAVILKSRSVRGEGGEREGTVS